MKCAKIVGQKLIETVNVDEPNYNKKFVSLKVKKAGICGSDIHNWDIGAPVDLIMGHEFCGIVENPGTREDLKVGDRVTALPISPCGKCKACKTGNVQYCPNTWKYAVGLAVTNQGSYAERTAVRPDMVVKVPDSLTDDEVAMVEPTAVALHAIHLADIKVGDNVLVIGAGVIGDLCAMFAKKNGANYVAISETNEKRGRKAVELACADEFFDAKNPEFYQNVLKNNPFGFDVVIDCSGNSKAVESALVTARPNATVVLVGVSLLPIEMPSALAVTKELVLKGAIAYTEDEFKECISLMERKNIDVSIFVDDIVSLDDVQKSFERLTSGDDDAIKILIDPTK